MNKTRTIAALACMTLIGAGALQARESGAHSVSNTNATAPKPNADGAKAAACTPSTHLANLEFNNVRALIETGGNMWEDRANGNPAYEVPKTADNSGPKAIFAGSRGIRPDDRHNPDPGCHPHHNRFEPVSWALRSRLALSVV